MPAVRCDRYISPCRSKWASACACKSGIQRSASAASARPHLHGRASRSTYARSSHRSASRPSTRMRSAQRSHHARCKSWGSWRPLSLRLQQLQRQQATLAAKPCAPAARRDTPFAAPQQHHQPSVTQMDMILHQITRDRHRTAVHQRNANEQSPNALFGGSTLLAYRGVNQSPSKNGICIETLNQLVPSPLPPPPLSSPVRRRRRRLGDFSL
jgi:hypothetical protein